jgi:hypothetical protein
MGLRLPAVSGLPDSAGAFGQGALHLCRTDRENRLQVRSTRSSPELASARTDRRIMRSFGSARSEGAAGGGSLRLGAIRPDFGPVLARVGGHLSPSRRRKKEACFFRRPSGRTSVRSRRGSRFAPVRTESGSDGASPLPEPRRRDGGPGSAATLGAGSSGPAPPARDGACFVPSHGNRTGFGPEGTHRNGGSELRPLQTGNRLGFGQDGDPPGHWPSLVSSSLRGARQGPHRVPATSIPTGIVGAGGDTSPHLRGETRRPLPARLIRRPDMR